MDGDGVCDATEKATGTKPLRADTDSDGVPDGVEDTDRDGVLDPGESNPRVPGLFVGSYPHIPEPMVFDLVRGLGARKGEVEVNNLAVLNLDPRRAEHALLWAPEVEWAVADGVAVELELPMQNRELEAVKGAFQVTLPMKRENLTHGLQVIGEYLLDTKDTRASALYVFGGRSGKWSLLAMTGGRAVTPMQRRKDFEALLNPGVYRDLSEKLTVGLEGNVALRLDGAHLVAVIPQVHWQVSRAVRLQVGGGAQLNGGDLRPLLATRVILE